MSRTRLESVDLFLAVEARFILLDSVLYPKMTSGLSLPSTLLEVPVGGPHPIGPSWGGFRASPRQ